MLAFIGAVIPSAGVLFLFWLGIRAMLQADRRERQVVARMESGGAAESDHDEDGDAETR